MFEYNRWGRGKGETLKFATHVGTPYEYLPCSLITMHYFFCVYKTTKNLANELENPVIRHGIRIRVLNMRVNVINLHLQLRNETRK